MICLSKISLVPEYCNKHDYVEQMLSNL